MREGDRGTGAPPARVLYLIVDLNVGGAEDHLLSLAARSRPDPFPPCCLLHREERADRRGNRGRRRQGGRTRKTQERWVRPGDRSPSSCADPAGADRSRPRPYVPCESVRPPRGVPGRGPRRHLRSQHVRSARRSFVVSSTGGSPVERPSSSRDRRRSATTSRDTTGFRRRKSASSPMAWMRRSSIARVAGRGRGKGSVCPRNGSLSEPSGVSKSRRARNT